MEAVAVEAVKGPGPQPRVFASPFSAFQPTSAPLPPKLTPTPQLPNTAVEKLLPTAKIRHKPGTSTYS